MSVNFYDDAGTMAGVDRHVFVKLAPGVPTGVPVPWIPHGVGVPFAWPTATLGKLTPKVLADARKMIQGGFDIYFVPHLPLDPAWGAGEAAQLAVVHATSGSAAAMMVHSVTGEGAPLATCLLGCIGSNANCNDPPWGALVPNTNVVFNLSSVKTSPSIGDYLGFAFKIWVGGWIGAALGKTLEWLGRILVKKLAEKLAPKVAELLGKIAIAIVKHIWRRMPDLWNKLKWIAGWPGIIQKKVQKDVDDLLKKLAEAG